MMALRGIASAFLIYTFLSADLCDSIIIPLLGSNASVIIHNWNLTIPPQHAFHEAQVNSMCMCKSLCLATSKRCVGYSFDSSNGLCRLTDSYILGVPAPGVRYAYHLPHGLPPNTVRSSDGLYYVLGPVNAQMSLPDAQLACLNMPGHRLAKAVSRDIFDAIRSFWSDSGVQNTRYYWLDLHLNPTGGFQWGDGTPFDPSILGGRQSTLVTGTGFGFSYNGYLASSYPIADIGADQRRYLCQANYDDVTW